MVVTLLDLKNAFGEVHHNLIDFSLKFHNVPDSVSTLIKGIYEQSSVQFSWSDNTTPPIGVQQGVLQGDPCSPLVFNICFNTLMKIVQQPQSQYHRLGYMWESSDALHKRSWKKFVDDAALITHDANGAQTLLNIATVWCSWADMKLRIDKCSMSGMQKTCGSAGAIYRSPSGSVQHGLDRSRR